VCHFKAVVAVVFLGLDEIVFGRNTVVAAPGRSEGRTAVATTGILKSDEIIRPN
jgi:hypothetical protein